MENNIMISKVIKNLVEQIEHVKSDQSVPSYWKRRLISIYGRLLEEMKSFFYAIELLENSKELLKQVKNGKMSKATYKKEMSLAREQVKRTVLFLQALMDVVEQHERKGTSNVG